ncbi:hypothetical protein EmuJ_001107300 [Echinococcus multilocularis]|uniref:C2H2-type domain-containing protein n=1 Tax=Echinococcus multilocularis TaxID=6211 RepID=A0A068YMK8_ECHMU|nr:hypothetical protein EmuJ_001107300 [Echinococcus multilocularis]
MALVCPICSLRFRHHHQLRTHFEAAHTELGRFACNSCRCNYRFLSCLQNHRNIWHNGPPTCLNERSLLIDYFFSLAVESQRMEFQLTSFIPKFSPPSAVLEFTPLDVPGCENCDVFYCARIFLSDIKEGDGTSARIDSTTPSLLQPAVHYFPFISSRHGRSRQ